MLQKTYHITADSRVGITDVTKEVAALDEYNSAAQILLLVFFECWDSEAVEGRLEYIKGALPKAEMVGITHHDSDFSGGSEELGEYDPSMILTFFFFDNPAFSVFKLDMAGLKDSQVGSRLNESLSGMEALRGVMLLAAEYGRNVDRILNAASEGYGDIPFFGAPGAVYDAFGVDTVNHAMPKVTNFVYDGENMVSDTLLAVIFYGKNLHIESSYNYGWTPVGRPMTITATEGDFVVKELDGRPAVEMFKKYLGLEKRQIAAINACEFPLIVERSGVNIARIPTAATDDGGVVFPVAISEGEIMRFSYGAQFRIFAEVYEDSRKHKDFAPQGMLLIICGNRLLFLKDQEHIEVDYYKEACPQLAYLHGNSEIYKNGDIGGELNSALVAVSFREDDPTAPGEDGDSEQASTDTHSNTASPVAGKTPKECQEAYGTNGCGNDGDNIQVPLENRVMFFMSAVTEDLMEMTRAAESANRAKGAFLSNMTHEIRSPINAVLGMDEMILRESRDQTILDYAQNIKSAGSTLLGLVNDVLDMSRLEAGRIEIIPVEYNTASLVNDLVTIISQRAADKGLDLILHVDPHLPRTLYGDEIRIKQVVTNILTNAVKYTEKGSVTLDMRVVKKEGDTITTTVRVQDTGIGIKEEDIPKLFVAFERIEEQRNRNIEGTGLGLNITMALLSMMGSRLQVESTYGEGSAFFFTIEQKIVDDTPMGDYEAALRAVREKRAAYHESFTAPEALILVVDDTPMNLLVLKSLLKQTLVQIHTADSGDEALKLITERRYDMIFLDDRMPKKSGVETLHEMKAMEHKNHGVPVVILTANSADDAKKLYIEEGFTDYLAKPIDPEVLENMLRTYLPAEKVVEASTDTPQTSDGQGFPAEHNHSASDDLFKETLTMYLEDIPDYVERLTKEYDQKDWENYTIHVHALKSSSRLIGEDELAALAESLEKAGDNGDTDYIRKHHTEFLNWYSSMETKYAGEIQPDDKKPAGDIGEEELKKAFLTIRELAGQYDYDSIEDIFGQLSAYNIPDGMQGEYDRLYNAFRQVDWDGMTEENT